MQYSSANALSAKNDIDGTIDTFDKAIGEMVAISSIFEDHSRIAYLVPLKALVTC
jgi:hypothetical protein